jgi:hypothetical protein
VNQNVQVKKKKFLEAPPTNTQVREALQILSRGVQHTATNFQMHYEYQQFIQELLIANKQQATIHKFFKEILLFFINVKCCTVTIN